MTWRFQSLPQLALFALLIRAVLPVGWMPAADGSFGALVFCTARGAIELSVENIPGNWPGEAPSKNATDAPCAFSSLVNVSAPEAFVDLVRPQPTTRELWFSSVNDAGHRYERHTASARGPPHSG